MMKETHPDLRKTPQRDVDKYTVPIYLRIHVPKNKMNNDKFMDRFLYIAYHISESSGSFFGVVGKAHLESVLGC